MEIERMSFFAKLYGVGGESDAHMWYLYLTIIALSILVYNLGFAKKLPLGKNIIVYILLALGCTVLTFFAVFLPVAEGLVVAALVLGIYKFRLHRSKSEQKEVI
jgi:YlaH-like protein